MTVGIGLIAPPVGLNVYVVNNLARDVPMAETYKGVFPFLAWDALRVRCCCWAAFRCQPQPGAWCMLLLQAR
jgi:TRAP-type C4-dicarboxylate transport system permease large subunit